MINKPEFKLGEYVVVQSKDDPEVFLLGQIIEADEMPNTGWRYFVCTKFSNTELKAEHYGTIAISHA